MKATFHVLHTSILGVSAALLMPFLASAIGPIAPSGSFTNTVTDPANAVWDFGGILTNIDIHATQHGVEAQASIAIDFTQSGQGKVNGSQDSIPVTLNLVGNDSGSVPLSTTVTEKGSINSTAGGSHLVFTVTATGIGTLPGQPKASNITLKNQINSVINNTNQTIIGTMKETASASGVGSVNETRNFTNSITAVGGGDLGDGSWTLTLNNLATTNNQVTGTATITLNSEQVFNYSVKGSFNSTKGTKLVLTGADVISKGSAIQVTLDTGNVVRNIKGRITGQNVNASF
jgi:hypothetical protein